MTRLIAALGVTALIAQAAHASPMTDFAAFARDGLTLGQSQLVVGGLVGTNGTLSLNNSDDTPSIYASGGATLAQNEIIRGDLVVNGNVSLNNGAHVTGNVISGGSVTMGQNSLIDGNVTARVDINVSNSGVHIGGVATAGGTVNGGAAGGAASAKISGGWVSVNPDPSATPYTPTIMTGGHTFPTGSSTPVNNALNFAPTVGVIYGNGNTTSPDIAPNSGRNVILGAAGSYYINDNLNLGNSADLFLNLTHDSAFQIFVNGNVTLSQNFDVLIRGDGLTATGLTAVTQTIAGESVSFYNFRDLWNMTGKVNEAELLYRASNVYLEASGTFNMNSGKNWLGTVYAGQAILDNDVANSGANQINTSDGSLIVGALYSDDKIELKSSGNPGNPSTNSRLFFARSNFLAPAAVPEPTSLALLGLGGLVAAGRRRRARAR